MSAAFTAYWTANGSKITAALATGARAFVAASLGLYLALGVGVFDLSDGQWKGILSAGIAAVALVAFNWASPNNPKYGIGSVTEPPV